MYNYSFIALDQYLTGPLPKELGDLGALRELLLINNHLSGECILRLHFTGQ